MFKSNLLRFSLNLLAYLPLSVNHALGGYLGRLLAYFPNRLKRITDINLQLCYPQMEATERRQLLLQSLAETGKTLTELGPLLNWPIPKLLSLTDNAHALAPILKTLDTGRGAILLVPHAGSWEYSAIFLASQLNITFMYAPPRMASVASVMQQLRTRTGSKLAPANLQGIRKLYKALHQGEVLAILPDQEPQLGSGVYSEFMGQPAYSMTLINRLVRQTNTDVFSVFFERLDKGQGYRISVEPVVSEIASDNIETAVTTMNQAVEAVIAKKPQQYLWNYKRFRRHPLGKKRRYKSLDEMQKP